MNSIPYEVISAPITLYYAAVGTVIPAVDATPGVAWTKIGTNGDLNLDGDEGMTVEHQQNINLWRSLGDAGARKAFMVSEGLVIKAKLVDLTLENMAIAVNFNTVTPTAAGVGTGGFKRLGLSRGFNIRTKALIAKVAASPYGEDWVSQYVMWRAMQTGSPAPLYKKGEPVGFTLEFTALVDPGAPSEDTRFGYFDAQHQEALT